MSKRTINLDEIMSRAQKKRKSNYDILDEGSRIVKSDNAKPEFQKKKRAETKVVRHKELLINRSEIRETAELPVQESVVADTIQHNSINPSENFESSFPDDLSKIENFMISSARDNLNAREYKILLCIMVETYFGTKSNVELSLERMGELSGIYKNHISGVIKSLVERGAIVKLKSENGQSNRYGLNFSFHGANSPSQQH